ncbi:hypothetical protein ACFQU1_23785 [Chelatococcus sp. GCM10030263]|uniref:hypothetical protein n=1 Tax=Chelatococcus sp. GCM10030263 TaxID=3273387 RepID=UPI0036092292
MTAAADTPIEPRLVLRDGENERLITTLEEALAFINAHPVGHAANRDGTIYRLQRARLPDEKAEAEDAFRAWVETTGLLVRVEEGSKSPGDA